MLGCHSLKMNVPPTNRSLDGHPPGRPAPLPSKYSFRVAPYVFVSDFDVPRDQPLFQELAGMRDQIYKELQLPPSNAVVQVYLFEDRKSYERFMQARYPDLPQRRAFFIAQPRAIGGADDLEVYTFWGDGDIKQDLRHQLTHALLHSVIRDVPLWLDEGLAEYFELPPDWKGVNPAHVETLLHTRFISLQIRSAAAGEPDRGEADDAGGVPRVVGVGPPDAARLGRRPRRC